jgi:hypothetical protein
MKYIFVAGAPGSKWSSVVKNIYYSNSVDRSDYSDQRTYYHDAAGHMSLMHLGVYFDPGMEFGRWFDQLDQFSRQECEQEFDKPFNGQGVRIIKSHVFCHHIDFLKQTWPDCPVVLVHRPNDACLGWWVRCGHFNITYPTYHEYYRDLKTMATIIDEQNRCLKDSYWKYPGKIPLNNKELATTLGLEIPPTMYIQDYVKSDIDVKVIL